MAEEALRRRFICPRARERVFACVYLVKALRRALDSDSVATLTWIL